MPRTPARPVLPSSRQQTQPLDAANPRGMSPARQPITSPTTLPGPTVPRRPTDPRTRAMRAQGAALVAERPREAMEEAAPIDVNVRAARSRRGDIRNPRETPALGRRRGRSRRQAAARR